MNLKSRIFNFTYEDFEDNFIEMIQKLDWKFPNQIEFSKQENSYLS